MNDYANQRKPCDTMRVGGGVIGRVGGGVVGRVGDGVWGRVGEGVVGEDRFKKLAKRWG